MPGIPGLAGRQGEKGVLFLLDSVINNVSDFKKNMF